MENFNRIPSETITDILSLLPAEFVLECKLVSKPWRDLVRHPSFSQKHLIHLDSSKLSCIFLGYEQGVLNEIYYSEYDESCHEAPFHRSTRMNIILPFKDYSFAGSCNGLICFSSWYKVLVADVHYYGSVYICNPITREYIILPTAKTNCWYTGFGYIPSTNEYKVVKMCYTNDVSIANVQVYTLGSGTGWRNARTMDISGKYFERCAGAFVNGALHWVDRQGTIIRAFNLANEIFSDIPAPAPPCWPRGYIKLGVLGNSLSATYCYDALHCDIWLLKKNKDNNDFTWCKECSFDGDILRPFVFTKKGRLLCCGHSKIYSYDPKAPSVKMDVSFGKLVFQAIPHRNTFVSLKALGEKDVKTMEFDETVSASDEETESSN